MSSLRKFSALAAQWRASFVRSGSVFVADVGHGMLEVAHNTLALLGLLILGAVLFASGRPELRHAIEAQTLSWLQARQEARMQALAAPAPEPDLGEPDAILRATASDPKDLSRAQASVALWLSRRYHVAPEPLSRLVQEAWTVGALVNLDPTLILSVMAVESSFNPFAQSPVGAQGLMQVMTKVHDDKYLAFGGSHAAFDPVTNLRVGVQVLKECIARAGSVEAGLRAYVGAANLGDDGGYAAKVLAHQGLLRLVASGGKVRTTASANPAPKPAAIAAPAAAPATETTPPPAAEAEAAVDKVALLH
jgi:soluble lytic murein transglycosylase-like protein